MLIRAGAKTITTRKGSFGIRPPTWQNNKPIELWNLKVIAQKVDNIHCNPVQSGFVIELWHWKYSSAFYYSGGIGLFDIDFVLFRIARATGSRQRGEY
jgi:hypothetical protein